MRGDKTAMLRRLLIVLLTVCLALPAAAMPLASHHVPSTPVAVAKMAMDEPPPCHQSPDSEGAKAMDHGCIGCIAPYHAAPDLALPFEARESILRPLALAGQPAVRAVPETPPPRA